jgi:hypothetical protein
VERHHKSRRRFDHGCSDIDQLASELFSGRVLDAAAIGPDEERFRIAVDELQGALSA